MNGYEKFAKDLEQRALRGELQSERQRIAETGTAEEKEWLSLLTEPEKYGPVVKFTECLSCDRESAACEASCLFGAIKRDENGKVIITSECVGCGDCVEQCSQHVLAEKKEMIPLIELLRERKTPIYAMIAPAFSGQFSSKVTSGRLRSAFKLMGFYGMLEVAMFADILTLKEALEFDRYIKTDKDFLLTSCCCPIWVALIKKSYSDFIPHIPPSVSPMVACGRSVKRMHPDAKTVFIGPCIAKKAEAKEKDIADAVDYVLTFQEIDELFQLMSIDLEELPEDDSDHSSTAGRIYAKKTGVSQAVKMTLERLKPERKIPLVYEHADGVPACRDMLARLSKGEINANFLEGMGCRGGCVGGPKSLIPADEATEHVNAYSSEASALTPVDNPHVTETLHRLGFDTIESLLERDNTFTRNFNL